MSLLLRALAQEIPAPRHAKTGELLSLCKREFLALAQPAAWPAPERAEERHERRNEERADDERVDQDADGHREREFCERLQRDEREEREAAGEHEPRDGDRARRARA